MPLNVTFRAGTLAEYNALQTKDEGTLYFIIDKNLIYRGTTLVTSRYLIVASQQVGNGKVPGFRLIDQVNGNYYDIPYLSGVNQMLQNNLSLRFEERIIKSNGDLLSAINADVNTPGSGEFEAGMVYRIGDDLYDNHQAGASEYIDLNPGQFAKPDVLTVKAHDLVVAIRTHRSNDDPFATNHECFAVIPVDLVNLVTSAYAMTANAVILGDGGKAIRPLAFGGANKILRTNGNNNGVEWVSPETVQNVMVWEDIAE